MNAVRLPLIVVIIATAAFGTACSRGASQGEALTAAVRRPAPPPTDCEMSFEPTADATEHFSAPMIDKFAPNRADRSKEHIKAAEEHASNGIALTK